MGQQLVFPFGRADQTLDTYLPGPNGAALAELSALAAGATQGWMLLRGPAGTGKTHLLTAACRRAAQSGRRAGYLPLAERAEFGVEALAGMESLDLLCLDDLEAAAGDADWERALFELLNGLRRHGGALAAAGTTAPEEAGFTLPDLVSRLNWGAGFGLKSLNDNEKLQALQLRARSRGLDMPEPVGRFLIQRLNRDMVTLFGVFERLDHVALTQHRRLTVPFVRQILGIGQKCTSSGGF